MANRKFYKTVIQVEILSEEPIGDMTDLDTIHYETTYGRWSRSTAVKKQITMNGLAMAKALIAQGSDPEFFMLDANGENIPEYIPD